MTEQARARLPIRLLPRRRGQIVPIIFFGIFLGFAVFWTAMAASMIGKADFDDAGKPEFWLGKLFPLFGVPFILIGAGDNVTRLLPPLIITEEDVSEAMNRLDATCAAFEAGQTSAARQGAAQ